MKTKQEVETFCKELSDLCNKWGVALTPSIKDSGAASGSITVTCEELLNTYTTIDYMERTKRFEPVDY